MSNKSSDHFDIDLNDVTCIEKEFGFIESSVNNLVRNLWKPSSLLIVKKQASMKYSSEDEVEHFVNLYIRDLIDALRLSNILEVRKGIEIFRLKHDLLLVTINNKIPILAIKVKTPQTGILDDPKVISRLSQYMKMHPKVFGVLTTFHEWKLIWLPDCDRYTASTSLERITFEMNENAIPNNVVSGTPVLDGSLPSIHIIT